MEYLCPYRQYGVFMTFFRYLAYHYEIISITHSCVSYCCIAALRSACIEDYIKKGRGRNDRLCVVACFD